MAFAMATKSPRQPRWGEIRQPRAKRSEALGRVIDKARQPQRGEILWLLAVRAVGISPRWGLRSCLHYSQGCRPGLSNLDPTGAVPFPNHNGPGGTLGAEDLRPRAGATPRTLLATAFGMVPPGRRELPGRVSRALRWGSGAHLIMMGHRCCCPYKIVSSHVEYRSHSCTDRAPVSCR